MVLNLFALFAALQVKSGSNLRGEPIIPGPRRMERSVTQPRKGRYANITLFNFCYGKVQEFKSDQTEPADK